MGKNVFALLPRQAVSIVRRDVQCVKWITVDFDHMCVPVAHSGEWTDPAVPEAASRPIYRRVNATEVSAFPEYCPDPKPIKRRTRFLVQFLKMWRLKVDAIASPSVQHREEESACHRTRHRGQRASRNPTLRLLRLEGERHGATEGRL